MKSKNDNYGLDTKLLWKITAGIFILLGLGYTLGYLAHVVYKVF